jgi:hypothetical protein
LLTPANLLAQGLSRLSGTVTDSTGAVIPGAVVTAIQVGTGTRTEVKSNAQGEYSFPALSPATYDLSITSVGFSGYKQKGILRRSRRM